VVRRAVVEVFHPPRRVFFVGSPCQQQKPTHRAAMLDAGTALTGTLVLLMLFQAWVSYRVLRSRLYKPSEKRAHFRLIWLIPRLGASLSLAMLASDGDHPPRDGSSSSS
jgi:hypothetical protein